MASKKKKKDQAKKRGATKFFLVLWLAAGLAFMALLGLWTEPAAQALALNSGELERITSLMLTAGTWIDDGLNLLIATAILVASVLPFAFGMRGKTGVRLYASLAVVAMLAVFATWLGLKRPVDALQGKTEAAAPR